jgi:hypothetical protein
MVVGGGEEDDDDAASVAEIPNLMNGTRRREWRAKQVAATEEELAALNAKLALKRTTRVHSGWKAPAAPVSEAASPSPSPGGTAVGLCTLIQVDP